MKCENCNSDSWTTYHFCDICRKWFCRPCADCDHHDPTDEMPSCHHCGQAMPEMLMRRDGGKWYCDERDTCEARLYHKLEGLPKDPDAIT